jgi:hypothetical protein
MSLQEPAQNVSTQHPSEASARKPPVSERRAEANRRNARYSTGPKTARGKRVVARNAIKHGLLAREVVIRSGEGEENLQDFDKLIKGLLKHYEPVGTVEESLVQTIAACWWRKARILRAENGEVCKRLDTAWKDHRLRVSDQANFGLAFTSMEAGLFSGDDQDDDKVPVMDRCSMLQGAQIRMRGHESGLAYLRALLMRAKSEASTATGISEPIRRELFLAFCFTDYSFARMCLEGARAKVEGPSPASAEDKRAHETLAYMATRIDYQLDHINLLERYAEQREKLEGEAEARSFSLPPADVTDKLIRYEAHLDRQLYRAMDQLERLQRLRGGETVPPPLNVNLGRRS